MDYKISWPTDMNGIKLDFGDTLYDIEYEWNFKIDHFELHSGLLGPHWYASDDCGNSVNLVICKKVGDENV